MIPPCLPAVAPLSKFQPPGPGMARGHQTIIDFLPVKCSMLNFLREDTNTSASKQKYAFIQHGT